MTLRPSCCRILAVLWFLAFASPQTVLKAVTPFPSGRSAAWSVRVWRSEGLPEKTVTGLTQTSDKAFWVATPGSISRFDGVTFENFKRQEIAPDIPQRIRTILGSNDGSLWVAFDHGYLARYNAGKKEVFHEGLPDGQPHSLRQDGEGSIWISYEDGAVCRIRDREVQHFKYEDGLPPGLACPLAIDQRGKVWFAKSGIIGVFEEGKFQTRMRLPVSRNRFTPAPDGGLWISSANRLLHATEEGTLSERANFDPKLGTAHVTVMLADHSGALWIGTQRNGLFRYDENGLAMIPISNPAILCLWEDHEGNLWAGTDGGGLNQVRPKAIITEGAEAGLPSESVQSICEDSSGILWACTKDGNLVSRIDGKWRPVRTGDEPHSVIRVAADLKGSVWIGTTGTSIHQLQNGKFTSWSKQNGVISHSIQNLLISQSGDVWIGGEGPTSLQTLHDGQLRTWDLPQPVRHIRALAEDATGDIWVGGDSGMLLRIHSGVLTDESLKQPAIGQTILCLHTSADGSLWLGTNGAGLGRIKGDRATLIRSAQGLYDDKISQIVADEKGWLWFGGERGLFKVRTQQLMDAMDGHSARIQSVHYQMKDLMRLQPDLMDSGSALRSRDGRLWIPMGAALTVIDPELLRDQLEPPPVFINRMNLDEHTIGSWAGVFPQRTEIDLQKGRMRNPISPQHREIEFGFTALSFSAPDNVHFRYQLQGFDERWREVGSQRYAAFSHLDAGDYVLHVKACNSDGVWNEKGAAFAFTVAPYLWQRWWFQLGTMSAFTSAVIAMVRYFSFRRLRTRLRRTQQQAALERERTRIARDLHDDLGGRLMEILLLSRRALKESGSSTEASDHVRTIQVKTQQGIDALDETVWAVNPANDTLNHLVNYLSQHAVTFLRTAGIRFRMDAPEHIDERPVPVEVRHHLLLVVKEALTNIVKYAEATEVRLQFAIKEDATEITIEDNGKGFDPATIDIASNGLRNMRQRMAEIGGQFEIKTSQGQGTRIFLAFLWERQK